MIEPEISLKISEIYMIVIIIKLPSFSQSQHNTLKSVSCRIEMKLNLIFDVALCPVCDGILVFCGRSWGGSAEYLLSGMDVSVHCIETRTILLLPPPLPPPSGGGRGEREGRGEMEGRGEREER